MKRRSLIKWLLYALGSLAVLVSLAIWIFLTFYFEGTLNTVVIPKIQEAAYKSTHGRFVLKLDKISYAHGTLVCNTFILARVAYGSNERGTVLGRLTIDSARFVGISWWDVLWRNDLNLISLQLNAPKLYMTDMSRDTTLPRIPSTVASTAFSNVPNLSFDSVVLRDISVFLPKPSGKAIEPTYRHITLRLTNFSLDPKHAVGEQALFSDQANFDLPGGSFSMDDSMYSIEVRGIHGRVADSLITIDTFAYRPNYDEQTFSDKYKYFHYRLDLRLNGIQIRGIDFPKLLSGGGLHIGALEAGSWFFDYYGDMRKKATPHRPDAILPHTLINTIKSPIIIDSVVLNNGTIQHRERATGSTHASLLTFTHARVSAHPLCTDTTSPLYEKPLQISLSALFLNQGKVVGTIVYPLHQKPFDLHINATVGAFDATALNSYLISNERKEVTSGKCLGGTIRMDVRSGTATTTVCPRYSDVSLKVLGKEAKNKGGIFEGIQSFIANTFVLRTNNTDEGNSKAFAGTTTCVHTSKEEFFEFIWIAMRTSIQKVIGF